MNTVPISELVIKSNVRAGNRNKDADYKKLKTSIKELGMLTPVLFYIDKNKKKVIFDGHQRVQIARELKHKAVPAYQTDNKLVTTNGEMDSLRQTNINTERVNMDIVDGIIAAQNIIKEQGIKTKKQLSKYLGKSGQFINYVAQLVNLHESIVEHLSRTPNRHLIWQEDEYNDLEDFLRELSLLPNETQSDLYQKFRDEQVTSERYDITWLDEFNSFYCNEHDHPSHALKEIAKLIGIDKVREYENNKNISVPTYNYDMFKPDEENFCNDNDFWLEIFYNEQKVGDYWRDIDIKDYGYDSKFNIKMFEWDEMARIKDNIALKAFLDKRCHNDPQKYKVKIISWNGNVTSLIKFWYVLIPLNNESINVDENIDENDSFKLIYNKLNKLAFPVIDKAIRHAEKKGWIQDKQIGKLNFTFKSIIDYGFDPSFVPVRVYDSESHNMLIPEDNPLSEMTDKITDANIIRMMIVQWWNEYKYKFTYDQINEWLTFMYESNSTSEIADMVEREFHFNLEFRKAWFNCFSVNHLSTLSDSIANNTTKKQAVKICSEIEWDQGEAIPFIDKCFVTQSNSGQLTHYR